jgi:lipopolysaccharide export system permease protein
MNTFSAYVFRQVMIPLLAVLGALAAIALLTQGLNQLDLIISNQRAGLAFAWVTLLAIPQLLSMILPLAVFFAVLYSLNRMHRESEIVVLYGAGVSRRRIISPILQLAFLAAFVHLGINVLVQPASYRERRETIYELRTDVASSLVREGAFTFPADNLTLYARERGGGGEMRDLMINDARGEHALTYTARSGAVTMINGLPAVVMRDGQVQRQLSDGSVQVLDFDRYVLQLGNFFGGEEMFFLKASDRYLYELFFPDLTAHYDQQNVDKFLAEGHSRLASPLINIAMALIAAAGVLVGDFNRQGYAKRMMIASGVALLLRLVTLALQTVCADQPSLNPLQYAVPILAALCAWSILGGKSPSRKAQRAIRQANQQAAKAA